MSDLETENTTDGVSESSPLSTGFIAATCVVCGFTLFCTLACLVIYLSREKHCARQLAAERNLNLADESRKTECSREFSHNT